VLNINIPELFKALSERHMNTKDTTFGGRASEASSRTLFQELFSGALYKRNQGRMVRQLTCLAIWFFVVAAAWRCHQLYFSKLFENQLLGYMSAMLLGAVGMWFAYRLVNWPRFADFLISVEAELNKVSWPTQKELIRASMVVIFTILFMSVLLFLYDAIWRLVFETMGVS
jgi:preprotein translocase subunit SecE